MRILIFLSAVAFGRTSEHLPITNKCSNVPNQDPSLSAPSFSENSDYNTHAYSNLNLELLNGGFSSPVSSVTPGQSFKSYAPRFEQELIPTKSPVTVTEFLSPGSYSSGQQLNQQLLSAGARIGPPSVFSAHVLPDSIAYHALSSTGVPSSYVNPNLLSHSFPLNTIPAQRQDLPFKSISKTVETISLETDKKVGSPTVDGRYSPFIDSNSTAFAESPTVLTQKSFSPNAASEISDKILASRFLPITDPNDNYLSKYELTSNQNTITTTDSVTTTSKPLVTIPSISILTSPAPTASPTPYTVSIKNPLLTTTLPKASFKLVTPYSYSPTTFKPYSTPLYSNYYSNFSTPRPLNTYSRVFSTPLPKTTSASTTYFPKATYKIKTLSPYPSTTFKPYSTTSYNNYKAIYSTSTPLSTYSKLPLAPNGAQIVNNFFKSKDYVHPIIKNVPNMYSTSVTTQSPPIVTSLNPFYSKQTTTTKPYSTDSPSTSYSGILSSPTTVYKSSAPTASPTPYSVSVTTPMQSIASPKVNINTGSSYSSTTFKPLSSSSPWTHSIYSTPTPFTSDSKVFSTPIPVFSNVSNFSPVTSKYYTNIFSGPYSTNAKSSLYSSVFPSPSTPSPSFPILTSPAPISPTPYSVTVSTPTSSTPFLKDYFETVSPTTYTSSMYKPYSTTVSLPFSNDAIYSTPKRFNSYSSVLSTPARVVPNSFKFFAASNDISHNVNTGKSAGFTASQSFKPDIDLSSRFDTDYTPFSHTAVSTTPQRIEKVSSTYPKSNIIHGSSFSFNSKPAVSQTLYSREPSVPLSINNINSGVFHLPATNRHQYYSGNLSPTFKVSENTLYSLPAPISYSSLSANSDLYSIPPRSNPAVHSASLARNLKLSSDHEVHSPKAFLGFSVQQAPLTREYHTVEEPIVKSWKSVDSWNAAPVSHFGSLFS